MFIEITSLIYLLKNKMLFTIHFCIRSPVEVVFQVSIVYFHYFPTLSANKIQNTSDCVKSLNVDY